MQLHDSLDQLPAFRNAVLTIGTFDGVHLGHQQLLDRIRLRARELEGESVLITFHPHPRIVLGAGEGLRLINTLDERIALLEQYGLDHTVVVPFTHEFASQPAEDYVNDFLLRHFRPKCLVIGYDHRFGSKRSGDIHLLRKMGIESGYEVEEISKQTLSEIGISSSKIRKALHKGNVELAGGLLGHPFEIIAGVAHGYGIGRTLGFPTANLQIEDEYKIIPADGVYAAMAEAAGKRYPAMLNIGYRPTFNGREHSIEIHLIGFEGDLYEEKLRVSFAARIRDEIAFQDKDALISQLENDRVQSLTALQRLGLTD